MKNQVTSIEQSKLLIELSVPAEMASMVWDTISPASHPILRVWDTDTDTKRWQVDNIGYVPAFTIADLIDMLPITCGDLHIHIEEITNSHKFIYYEGREDIQGGNYADLQTVLFVEDSLVESCVKAIEWVVSNNYTLNI